MWIVAAVGVAVLLPGPRAGLRIEPPVAAQGSVVLVRLATSDRRPVARAEGRIGARSFALYPALSGRAWLAPIGFDLEAHPGSERLVVRIVGPDGRALEQAIRVPVKARKFPVQRLTVPLRMVHPDARALERIRREEAVLARVFGTAHAKLFEGRFSRPVPGRETANFGSRRIFNGVPRQPHGGVDFRASAGTPVRSPARGKIVLVADHYFSGRTVIVAHGLGLFTQYAHLSVASVREGQIVERGSVLGRVGSTGRATGPHLHWAARLTGARVDPLDLTRLPL
jgi:murein DD-endopeptidase MepM/ murein hydrolase activator NlpD